MWFKLTELFIALCVAEVFLKLSFYFLMLWEHFFINLEKSEMLLSFDQRQKVFLFIGSYIISFHILFVNQIHLWKMFTIKASLNRYFLSLAQGSFHVNSPTNTKLLEIWHKYSPSLVRKKVPNYFVLDLTILKFSYFASKLRLWSVTEFQRFLKIKKKNTFTYSIFLRFGRKNK